jgi:hypothetical protein
VERQVHWRPPFTRGNLFVYADSNDHPEGLILSNSYGFGRIETAAHKSHLIVNKWHVMA